MAQHAQILEKGELQVSDKERHAEYETLYRARALQRSGVRHEPSSDPLPWSCSQDVVQVLVDKCVNPHTGRPYTSGVLDRALRATHFSVDPTRSAKQQALDALPRLAASFPIARARMRFRLLLPAPCEAALLVLLAGQEHSVESREPCGAAGLSLVVTVEPGAFRLLDAFTREQCEGQGRMEVLALAVVQEGEGEGGCAGEQAPELSSQQQPREPAVTQQMARASLSDGAAPAHARQARAEGGGSGGGGGCGGCGSASAASAGVVVYARGPLAALPDEHASRRERFAELDALQPGWQVELRCRAGASVVDALFFSPAGEAFKSFADARRAAMRTRT